MHALAAVACQSWHSGVVSVREITQFPVHLNRSIPIRVPRRGTGGPRGGLHKKNEVFSRTYFFFFNRTFHRIFIYSKDSFYTTEETNQDTTLPESNTGTIGNVY